MPPPLPRGWLPPHTLPLSKLILQLKLLPASRTGNLFLQAEGLGAALGDVSAKPCRARHPMGAQDRAPEEFCGCWMGSGNLLTQTAAVARLCSRSSLMLGMDRIRVLGFPNPSGCIFSCQSPQSRGSEPSASIPWAGRVLRPSLGMDFSAEMTAASHKCGQSPPSPRGWSKRGGSSSASAGLQVWDICGGEF